jgi:ethanolamine ammonia-lyase large subunit
MLCMAGCNFIMGIPGSDDIMLNYQSTSFHDALVMRQLMGLRAAPEFEQWLQRMGVFAAGDQSRLLDQMPAPFEAVLARLERA